MFVGRMPIVDLNLFEEDIFFNPINEGLTEENDLSITMGNHAIRQTVMSRIKTYINDWYIYPDIGANLEDFLGSPNTRETADLVSQNIYNTLTFDGLVAPTNLDIYPVPVNDTECIFYITLQHDRQSPTILSVVLDFSTGMGVFV